MAPVAVVRHLCIKAINFPAASWFRCCCLLAIEFVLDVPGAVLVLDVWVVLMLEERCRRYLA